MVEGVFNEGRENQGPPAVILLGLFLATLLLDTTHRSLIGNKVTEP
jgi:hypothetical protein